MIVAIKPKLLKKASDGRIFTYTDALASRGDMIPVWESGVDPNHDEKPMAAGGGLRDGSAVDNHLLDKAGESRVSQLRVALNEKNQLILSLQDQLNQVSDECVRLNEEVARLSRLLTEDHDKAAARKAVNGLFSSELFADGGEEIVGGGEAVKRAPDEPMRKSAIDKAVLTLLEKNDPISFTGSGKLRLPLINDLCGFDVSAVERDEAVERFSMGKK